LILPIKAFMTWQALDATQVLPEKQKQASKPAFVPNLKYYWYAW
jgi:hypothetical protein